MQYGNILVIIHVGQVTYIFMADFIPAKGRQIVGLVHLPTFQTCIFTY